MEPFGIRSQWNHSKPRQSRMELVETSREWNHARMELFKTISDHSRCGQFPVWKTTFKTIHTIREWNFFFGSKAFFKRTLESNSGQGWITCISIEQLLQLYHYFVQKNTYGLCTKWSKSELLCKRQTHWWRWNQSSQISFAPPHFFVAVSSIIPFEMLTNTFYILLIRNAITGTKIVAHFRRLGFLYYATCYSKPISVTR